MSTTQGEKPQSIRTTVIGGAIAVLVAGGAIFGVALASENARAEAAQLRLLSVAKSSSIIMEAASTEDATVATDARRADAIAHTDLIAAQEQAAYDAKIAAQKAAAAQAAADLAAQQAAQQQAAQVQTQTVQAAPVNSGPAPASGSSGLPAGSPVPWIQSLDPNNSAGGSWDTQACASHNASGNPAVCD